ncbi:nucleoside diphosphate kinase A1-like [Amphiura filiformis]|uniref:nucleoside diphosphate kinase A1-like n=1 Tax=Amphiura filiformis TaxID=82378 RepID=UPI003B21F425
MVFGRGVIASSCILLRRLCINNVKGHYGRGFSVSKVMAKKLNITERTFLMVKPDGVQRGLIGDIMKRFEQKGFKLVACKFQQATEDLLKEHYAELADKPFYPGLCAFMSSGPVLAMVWEGLGVVKTARQMMGETDPAKSLPGTIRGDFCINIGRNILHGSDSVETANREIALWFKGDKDLCEWTPSGYGYVYEGQ